MNKNQAIISTKRLDCDHPCTQGINKSANFCFLQRLSVIFGFSRVSYLASAETVCDLLLPAETAVLGK